MTEQICEYCGQQMTMEMCLTRTCSSYYAPTFDELAEAVDEWASEKRIHSNSSALVQMDKVREEAEELTYAIFRLDPHNIHNVYEEGHDFNARMKDARMEAGDLFVTVINVCWFLGVTPQEALEMALKKIATRNGRMVDGKFVKDEK